MNERSEKFPAKLTHRAEAIVGQPFLVSHFSLKLEGRVATCYVFRFELLFKFSGTPLLNFQLCEMFCRDVDDVVCA